MADRKDRLRFVLLTIVCILIGSMMFYRGVINLTQYPGNWERIPLGPIFLGGVYSIYLMWRGWRIGWWLFTALNFLVGFWFIFILEDIWRHHVLPHIVFSAVFLPFYCDMRKSEWIAKLKKLVISFIWEIVRYLLTVYWVVELIEMVPPLRRFVNRFLINRIVGRVRTRPHPFSTQASYSSWASLTEKQWSARHLEESDIDQNTLPDWTQLQPLFKRTPDTQRHCPKSTCLFPAFAQYLTDGFIRTKTEPYPPNCNTDPDRLKKNTSTHNIDLCTLYGRNKQQTDALRVKNPIHRNRGKLKSQVINGEEYAPFLFDGNSIKPGFGVLDLPLGLDILYEQLNSTNTAVVANAKLMRATLFASGGDRVNSGPQTSMINTLLLREHNRLATALGKRESRWTDDRVFETARNIVIVQFIKVVVEDYINHIAPIRFLFKADPSVAWRADWNRPNWITTEFSLLYRWHALVPDEIVWAGKKYDIEQTALNNRPLIDAGLARGFEDMSAQRAGELGPRNTTNILLDVENKSVEQGRLCKLKPFTEYLNYLDRNRVKLMSEISSDPEVTKLLKDAYKNKPEEVDFFIGLFCEDRVKNSPLPSTILPFVGLDAFSQALTNPLLSKHVFNEKTFTEYGWGEIQSCQSLLDILRRNVADPDRLGFVGMTRLGWQYE